MWRNVQPRYINLNPAQVPIYSKSGGEAWDIFSAQDKSSGFKKMERDWIKNMKASIQTAEHTKISCIAGSVLLSLFMKGNEKCNTPHALSSTQCIQNDIKV